MEIIVTSISREGVMGGKVKDLTRKKFERLTITEGSE